MGFYVVAMLAATISLLMVLYGIGASDKIVFFGGSICFLLSLIVLAVCQVVETIKANSKRQEEFFKKNQKNLNN